MREEAYRDALSQKHAEIDRIIAQESLRPHPDDAKINELKRRKLQLKDKLRTLQPH